MSAGGVGGGMVGGMVGGAGVPQKQIRFVNNEGQPPAKRRRVNAAYVTSSRSSI